MATTTMRIVFETHATSEDNERGVATGWLPGRLSAVGRRQARGLAERRRDDRLDAVYTSDLGRAVETAEIAFAGRDLPVVTDRRLRECGYGDLDGAASDVVHGLRAAHLDVAYPGGESWREAVGRVGLFLDELSGHGRAGTRVLVIGHIATRWGLAVRLDGASLEELVAETFVWRPGWEYDLPVRR